MRAKKPHIKKGHVILANVIVATVLLVGSLTYAVLRHDPAPIKSEEIDVLQTDNKAMPKVLTLQPRQDTAVVESEIYKAKFEFNALAPMWRESSGAPETTEMEVRTSSNGKTWSEWMHIEAGAPMKDGAPNAGLTVAETPIFIDGQYFQYRLELERDKKTKKAPEVRELKFNYIDSRQSGLQKGLNAIQAFFQGNRVGAADQGPGIVSRAAWGSPDPHGDKFRGTNDFWRPTHSPVTQVFLHHTVNTSLQSDPESVVRGIWQYHARTLGWGDIGYNYLIDSQGRVYEGRFGGDNVVAGHVLHYNKASLGVALLGCFDSNNSTCNSLNNGNTKAPANRVISSLTTFLSWKTTNFEIDPTASHSFCKTEGGGCLSLRTIAAHGDAYPTSCPGNLAKQMLSKIRTDTKNKKTGQPWAYSAKQLSFNTASLSGVDTTSVTLAFKNNGTQPWSNSANDMRLRTANPSGKSSSYQTNEWIDGQTPAVMNETSVAPGGTGTFTFMLKRPNLKQGTYFEEFRLESHNNTSLKAYFTLPIAIYCTFGEASNPRPNGLLIRNPQNGKIYLLDEGKKRHIASSEIAQSHNLDTQSAINAKTAELGNVATGTKLEVNEGAMVRTKNGTKRYIIDEEGGVYTKRHIDSPATIEAFDLHHAEIYVVSQSQLDSYANGPTLSQSSLPPDGILVRAPQTDRIYKVEDGAKRWIAHAEILKSYGYAPRDVRQVSQARIDSLADGAKMLRLREGTLARTKNTSRIYAIDDTADIHTRRWIPDHESLASAGFKSSALVESSAAIMDSYANGAQIKCHQ